MQFIKQISTTGNVTNRVNLKTFIDGWCQNILNASNYWPLRNLKCIQATCN